MDIKCSLCCKQMPELSLYLLHIKNDHKEFSRLPCVYCSRVFDNIYYYKFHLKRHILKKSNTHLNEQQVFNFYSESTFFNNSEIVIQPKSSNNQENSILIEFTKFIIKYYAKSEIPRKYTIESINDFYKFIKILFETEYQKSVQNNSLDHLKKVFEQDIPKTEHKFLKNLVNLNVYVKSETFNINYTQEECLNYQNRIILRNINHTLQLLSPTKLFEKLFNQTKFLVDIISYVEDLQKLNSNYIYDFIQSSYYECKMKNLPSADDIFYLPIFIYFDDFEVNNPLGSRATISKVGGVYLKIPCLPLHLQSKLNSIFLGMLFFSEDRKSFGNKRIFHHFIDEMNKLCDTGISIKLNKYKVVKLIPSLIVGDNLGLNSILGFTESFNSHFCCRFCNIPKSKMNICTRIDEKYPLFSAEQYTYFIETNVPSSIKEISVWNEMRLFHVTNNLSVDIMHDLLEGICRYDLSLLLEVFILKKKYFTLEHLNYIILTFNFGFENKNKPPLFNKDFFPKKNLKFSASEMFCFVINFSLLIGEIIPRDCFEWNLYLTLRKILDICFSLKIHTDFPEILEYYIHEHHELYLEISGLHLPPKFHLLLHYPHIMNSIGPLTQISSMRYEAFHQNFKKTAYNTKCKKNIILTMSVKNSIKIANFILNYDEITQNLIQNGPLKRLKKCDIQRYNVTFTETAFSTKFIKYNGRNIKPGMVTFLSDVKLGLIDYIIKYRDKYFFALSLLDISYFNSHFYVYVIERNYNYVTVPINSVNLNNVFFIYDLNNANNVVNLNAICFDLAQNLENQI